MEDTYRTLEKPAEGLFRDRNSRFLAFGYPLESMDEINETIADLKKKYHDARHHCYAYRLGYRKDVFRLNDDGEPSGTAGKQIFGQLLSHDLTNLLVVVVRYFGGTLLGTGGLINAYRSATRDMLTHAVIVTRFIEDHYRITFPYEKLNAVMRLLNEENLVPVNPVYEDLCTLDIAVRMSHSASVSGKLATIPDVITKSLNLND